MNPMKILLVDDSKSARYALRLQLQRHGVMVETVDSAEAALERIEEDPPDAVFMDHIMPGMNGIEALDILKSNLLTTQIPVVMCTSYENPEFAAQAQRKGALDILSKAAAPDKLPGLIECLERTISGEQAPAPSRLPVTPEDSAGDATDRLIAKQLDERMHALVEPVLERIAERLSAQLIARMENRLSARVEGEAEPLQRLGRGQSERVQISKEQSVGGRLPGAVPNMLAEHSENMEQRLTAQIAQEGGQVAGAVQEMIVSSVDRLVGAPTFLRNALTAIEKTAARNAAQALERRTAKLADGSTSVAGEQRRVRFLLAAGAAGTGILAAAVYFLVR